jgi:putative endonuclease
MTSDREPADEDSAEAQRRIAFRFGLSAESRAAAYLVAKGYRILARRFRTSLGEIDIVAMRRGVLVFVEVKARDSFDAAAEAIGKRQQNRIIAAAQLWLAAHPEDAMRDMRFDVVLVVPGRLPRHLPAAFDASV